MILRALALVLLLAACADAHTGEAACLQQDASGAQHFRYGQGAMVSGLCPTRAEMIAGSEMDARFDAAGCRMGCRLGGDYTMLLNQPPRPMPASPRLLPMPLPAARVR